MDKETKKPSDMNEADLPDVRAFNDEFTRDFLQSTEETKEGFYPFLSGTGKYKMDFPAEGVIGEKAYTKKKRGYEEFLIHIKDETGSIIRINYYPGDRKESKDQSLDLLKGRLGYDGEFEKKEEDGQSLYYTDFERRGFHTYGGYVQNEQADGGIDISYKIDCRDDKQDICEANKETIAKKVMKWMKSVQLIHEEGEDE